MKKASFYSPVAAATLCLLVACGGGGSPDASAILATPASTPTPAPAGNVIFQDTATMTAWDDYLKKPQHIGQINVVSSPLYKDPMALQFRQIFVGNDGVRYHSELHKGAIQTVGKDQYYGQAIYLPADWQFHDQNVTFQQWAPDNNAGPWLMMFVQGTKLRYAAVAGAQTGIWDIADIGALRGTWIRIVTRIDMTTTGVIEIWVNGNKAVSRPGNWTTDWASNSSIRWSTGIYCTGWYEHQPLGQSDLSIFHDHFRVATTYDTAEPANW